VFKLALMGPRPGEKVHAAEVYKSRRGVINLRSERAAYCERALMLFRASGACRKKKRQFSGPGPWPMSANLTLSRGERVDRDRRFYQPAPAR
jgi:hypothetical protein